jgi:hypothetical protein
MYSNLIAIAAYAARNVLETIPLSLYTSKHYSAIQSPPEKPTCDVIEFSKFVSEEQSDQLAHKYTGLPLKFMINDDEIVDLNNYPTEQLTTMQRLYHYVSV